MPSYVITGKLGSGKSLVAVGRVRFYLLKGLRCATNLDLDLKVLVGHDKKNTHCYRVPDMPTVADLYAIGSGNPGIDIGADNVPRKKQGFSESDNGILLLDEMGTWMNTRDFQSKDRKALLDWFRHARKRGWDLYFILQDIQSLDKQARNELAEHVVYCRRTDRWTIPFIGWFYRLITGSRLPLPKAHMGVVKYGSDRTSMTVDTWWVFGGSLFHAYDTLQSFSPEYSDTTYRVLPPYFTHGRYRVPMTVRNLMRFTKIYWKRFNRPLLACLFFAAGAAYAFSFSPDKAAVKAEVKQELKVEAEEGKAELGKAGDMVDENHEPVLSLRERFVDYRISGFSKYPGSPMLYNLINGEGEKTDSNVLSSMGYGLIPVDECGLTVLKGSEHATIGCN